MNRFLIFLCLEAPEFYKSNLRSSYRISTGANELQHSHLRGGILHSDAIGSQSQITRSAFDILSLWFVEMRVEHLLGQRQRSIKSKIQKKRRNRKNLTIERNHGLSPLLDDLDVLF